MNRRAPLPLLAGSLGVGALLLASCGGGSAAPTGPAATPTPLPAGQWFSMQEADVLWQQIAASATLVKPILRPTYLLPGLTEVRLLESDEPLLQFTIVYADASHQQWLSIAAGSPSNPALSGPRSEGQQVVIRNTYATYQLYDTDNPTGSAWMLWQEPGTWGAPADPNQPDLDHVPYQMSSHGLSRDDLMKVADSLQPVEE